MKTWQFSSPSSSSPSAVCRRIAIWFAIVAVGRKIASSWPSRRAARSSSSLTDGSSRFCSSPTAAAAIAPRMPAVGRVAVSERRSITVGAYRLFPSITNVLYKGEMDALAALADPTRRRIVELLAEREHDVAELNAHFPISQPAVSRHLRVLREHGLVRSRPDAQRRLYSLDPTPLAELDDWLGRYRSFWAQRLDALETELRRARKETT